jgi:oxygen-independent coproporphyrinogen-3 oxidase
VRDRIDETQWVQFVERELNSVAALQNAPLEVSSVFFGGGTPSLMSGRAVEAILNRISRLWSVSMDAEVTLEANPNSVDQERFNAYRAAGVNRISIGVQSFEDNALRQLGRVHDSNEAKRAIQTAALIFPRVNFDLIYARPGQTAADWAKELQHALSLGTEHLSLYQLTIEQGTAFASLHRQGKLSLPDENTAAEMYELTQEMCEASGMCAYEVSNHASPGGESRHNLLYWRYGDYAGIGPGAHGRLTINGERWALQSERLPERWAARIESGATAFSMVRIPAAEAAREQVLMNLRINEGLHLSSLASRWGMTIPAERLVALQQLRLIKVANGTVSATPRGRLVLNRVIGELAESLGAV